MLGLGETLARRRGLLRAMKSLRGLEDYYRRIVFSVADQAAERWSVQVSSESIVLHQRLRVQRISESDSVYAGPSLAYGRYS